MSSLCRVCDAGVKQVSSMSIASVVRQACVKGVSNVSTVCRVCQVCVECMKHVSSVSLSLSACVKGG